MRGVGTVVLLVGGLAARGVFAADPPAIPPVPVKPYLARVVFRIPSSDMDRWVVRFPLDQSLAQSIRVFRGEDGARRSFPCRVVYRDAGEAFVQIDIGAVSNLVGDCSLYGLAEESASPETEGTGDVFRVGIDVRARYNPTLPTSWDRFLYFMEKSTSPVVNGSEERLGIEDFAETVLGLFDRLDQRPAKRGGRVPKPEEIEKRRKVWSDKTARPTLIVRLQGLVLFPRDGEYRFAVFCRDSGYVRVDSVLAAEVAAGAQPSAWHVGAARWYAAGLHSVELLTASRDPSASVGWAPPGSTTVAPVPDEALVGPGPVLEGRLEVKGQFIHADFEAQPLEAFRFRGCDAVFVPVRFADRTRNPGGALLKREWRIGSDTFSDFAVTRLVTPPGAYRVVLTVADVLGASSSCARVVDCRVNLAREHAVEFGVAGLPAVCFEGDTVRPYAVGIGSAPPLARFDLRWTLTGIDGRGLGGGVTNLALAGTAVKVDFGKFSVSDIGALEWGVQVGNVTIDSGTVVFSRPPFSDWPTTVVADRLCDARNRRHVLVTSRERATAGYDEPACRLATGNLLLLDDSLVPGCVSSENRETYDRLLPRLVEGTPTCRYESLAPSGEAGASLRSLAKLVALPGLVGEGRQTVVLSVGVQDLLLGVDADTYERQLTAMVDKLLANADTGLVLVTPPPYPEMEARLRPFAVAVRRVGDARAVPVVDLYTAFIGLKESGPFFERGALALTPRGHRLAADRIGKALSGATD